MYPHICKQTASLTLSFPLITRNLDAIVALFPSLGSTLFLTVNAFPLEGVVSTAAVMCAVVKTIPFSEMDAVDLKTRQFAQVLAAIPTNRPISVECTQLAGRIGNSAPLRALFVGLVSAFMLVLIRPPFVLCFEHDKTRPWKGRSFISWVSVLVVSLLVALASFLIPLLC